LNYTPTALGGGYKVEEKLHLGVSEQQMVEYHCTKPDAVLVTIKVTKLFQTRDWPEFQERYNCTLSPSRS
jgi:hypothetical protein